MAVINYTALAQAKQVDLNSKDISHYELGPSDLFQTEKL